MEKKATGQYLEAASISKGQDPNALFHAAKMNIGQVDKDIPYIMREMKNHPGTATDIRNWLELRKKKKGTYNTTYISNTLICSSTIFL